MQVNKPAALFGFEVFVMCEIPSTPTHELMQINIASIVEHRFELSRRAHVQEPVLEAPERERQPVTFIHGGSYVQAHSATD